MDIDECIKMLRKQRHDFMNDLQVVYGYMQGNKQDKALEYIDTLCTENVNIGEIYSVNCDALAHCLEENIKKSRLKGSKINLDIEIEFENSNIFKEDYYKKSELVNNIFNELEKKGCNSIYIYFFEDSMGQSLFLSNSENMKDEIEWMDEWENLSSDINGIAIHNCSIGNNIAYRVTFDVHILE